MKRYAFLFALMILPSCAEPEAERPEPSAAPPASGGHATLDQWLNQGQPGAPATAEPRGGAMPAGHPPTGAAQAPTAGAPPGAGPYAGTVTETMNSGGYTYMLVDTPDGPVWVATSEREMSVGVHVSASGMVMQGFHSNTLDRTFDRLVLASNVEVTAPAAP